MHALHRATRQHILQVYSGWGAVSFAVEQHYAQIYLDLCLCNSSKAILSNACVRRIAMMDNRGTILAFDKDSQRLERLHANVKATGATCIRAEQGDFLELDPSSAPFANVRGLLLDPSCSGSGTVWLDRFLSTT